MKQPRVLILGAGGMLGHKLTQVLSRRYDVIGTVRTDYVPKILPMLAPAARFITAKSLEETNVVEELIHLVEPSVIVNCVGIVKQLPAAEDKVQSIKVNALLPHRIASECAKIHARFIHISTDCVFSGMRGKYTEDDLPDCHDIYGMTKYLGEVADIPNCLTLRSSIIGRQIGGQYALVEWFLSQRGRTVEGYTDAIFSGFTTLALSELISHLVAHHQDLQGLYHVSSDPISKFELLKLIKKAYSADVQIEPSSSLHCDRSLDSTRFKAATQIRIPTWSEMIANMQADDAVYSNLASTPELAKHS